MGREIERKFLVRAPGWRDVVAYTQTLRQGYLAKRGDLSVRIRIIDGAAGWLTIKHGGTALDRAEFEYPVPAAEAQELLGVCEGRLIEKHRHHLILPGGDWVVDEFAGQLAGLVLVEVEIADARQPLDLPDWLGPEVTGDPRYYNATLAGMTADGEI